MSTDAPIFDFDNLVNDAEQHVDEAYDELHRAFEDHINDAELYFSSLVSWFYMLSDNAEEDKENIGLLANTCH